MQKKKSAPTMKDVAREAGVSLGTVSKVINHKPVGDEYVQKVKAAIEALDYHVNSYAQGLKAARTNTIAMLIPTTDLPFYGKLVYFVNRSLLKRGYRMLLCCTDFDHSLEQEYIDMAQQNKVDGIIILSYNPSPVISPDLPVISFDRYLNQNIPVIACDNYAGGELASRKLKELGCKKVVLMWEGATILNEPDKRRAGFENGCRANDLDYELCLFEDGHENDAFYKFIDEHINNGHFDYDGIFCVTDTLAFKIRTYLEEEKKLHIPKDVQLIGFDGIMNFGACGYTCSTIVQPVADMAEMAVELLLQDNTRIKPQLVCLPVSFAEGGTTLPA
ncbi:LacI family DNA-binding transcriptional regulator [Ruminococcus sp.]|uniref:LacI family DNA-binding transcriptional regulator n=1 Tax=Ruminococcus sp. TaxID=41978 RepID=UPI00258E4938|nr:LacI family DNA-binding transcriptional regulator [Ruminococcus sp.]MCR5021141.1 LacI family DNA-binding transcriptional regulator [Ruminococcus sp.]